jgi:transcriptional regulator with XRE-family HTH domain
MKKKAKKVPRETLEQTQLKAVGRLFRNRRNDLQLQLQEVAAKCGVSSLTISKLEKGQLDNSSLGTLNSISSVLGLQINIRVESNGKD